MGGGAKISDSINPQRSVGGADVHSTDHNFSVLYLFCFNNIAPIDVEFQGGFESVATF
jgi:hypothetical protein